MTAKDIHLALITTCALFLIGTNSDAAAKTLLQQQYSETDDGRDVQSTTPADSRKAQDDTIADREIDRNRTPHRNRQRAPLMLGHAVPARLQRSRAQEASDVHGPVATQRDGAQRTHPSEAFNTAAFPTQPVSVARRGTLPGELRHHGSSPAVVDGLAANKRENANGLNGTRVHRKP